MDASDRKFLESSDAEKGIGVRTVSGVLFSISDPRAGDVRPNDIAWALSRINRFNGHTGSSTPLNVAQHSVMVMGLLQQAGFTKRETLMFGLLHDAHEAYIGDITSPMKKLLGKERVHEIADRVQVAIHRAFGLGEPSFAQKAFIRKADIDALLYEKREYGVGATPLLEPWTSTEAYDHFLGALRDLQHPAYPAGRYL